MKIIAYQVIKDAGNMDCFCAAVIYDCKPPKHIKKSFKSKEEAYRYLEKNFPKEPA